MVKTFKVTSKVGWSSNNYDIIIDGNKITMIYEKAKGVPEVLNKLNVEGLNAVMTDSKTIKYAISDATEEQLIESSRNELDAVVKASMWPVKFSYKEEI